MRGLLLLLFGLSFASPLAILSDGPPWLVRAGEVGVVAFAVLVTVWAVTGFVGFEHRAGLRVVLRRGQGGAVRAAPRWPLALALAGALGGVGALHLGLHSASLALATAVAAGAVMVLAVARWFAIFATLSIAGIALGVAALIVVQSVATGFQHEFEHRVLGVYSHINVTRPIGIAEYRRFEAYLRTLEGVTGASTFVYSTMALAPDRIEDALGGKTVLVKGIDPATAHEVIDLETHLADAGHADVAIAALTSDVELQPVPDADDELLPPAIAATPDPRGEGAFERAIARWRALPDDAKHPGTRPRVLAGDDWPDAGDASERGTDPAALPTMFVGAALARDLGLEIGDVVSLVDPGSSFGSDAPPELRRYRIAAIFRAGFQEYDQHLAYVHIRELQWFRWRGRDLVSGVDLRVANVDEAPAISARVRQVLGEDDYSVVPWQKLNANLFQSIGTQKSVLTVILSLVSAVAGFNVLAALWTMVVRRTAEIAILMAMGATASSVARIFQFSGMTLGAVGSLAGVALGLVLCWLVDLYGYSLDPEVYFIEHLPVELSLVQIGAIAALTLGICFVATIPPSLRASKLRPVEGLRYE